MVEMAKEYSGPVRIAVIGGTGLKELPGFEQVASLSMSTPWGSPSSPVTILHHLSPTSGQPVPIAFIARHGIHHQLAPHEVPSRANIAVLRSIGVRTVIAFSAVGSLQEHVRPRDFVVPDQIIDRTKGVRPWTFFEDGLVGHVPFAEPFDEKVAAVVRRCGHSLEGEGVKLHDQGVLVCMEGPQFSTRAESRLYRTWGASVINMSALPEAKLAREAEMAYQMICMSTDYDCWRDGDSDNITASVSVDLVMRHMRANASNALRFIAAVLDELCKDEHVDLIEAKHLLGHSKIATSVTSSHGISAQARQRQAWLFPEWPAEK